MDWTVTQATTLYGSNVDPSQLGTANLGSALGTSLPAGATVTSADPPNTVAGFMQATYQGQSGWVASSALKQKTMLDTAIMVGFWGGVLYGLYYLIRKGI